MAEATIRDVARQAGVSVASVSRALNGRNNVTPLLRERVETVARQLHYVPHAGARSLSMARSHTIGVVLPDLHGEFFSEIVRGMDREASARGLHLILSNQHGQGDDAAQVLRAMRGRVDGLIVMAPELSEVVLTDILPPSLPSVLINSCAGGNGRPRLCIDNRAGVDMIVDHLVDRGCRHLAHIAGPSTNLDARERADAFVTAVARRGVEGIVVPGDFSEESGARATTQLLALPDRPNAIFAANDMMAIGCLLALRASGVSIPGTIAIAGFDDIPPAKYLDLTTARVRIVDIGRRALVRLAAMIEGETVATDIELFAPELVVRSTTDLATGATRAFA